MRSLFPALLPAVLATSCALGAQQTPIRPVEGVTPAPIPVRLTPNLLRLSGHDAYSGLEYVRIVLTAGTPSDATVPTLTGQCTRDASGKLHFELFANFGSVSDLAFYPPWHSTGRGDLYPPHTTKVPVTLEFLGYTHIKPVRRAFEQTLAPGPTQLRYVNPGADSPNLEPPAWFFQYLRALPTLRLSIPGHTADFPAADWLRILHTEPLCAASGA